MSTEQLAQALREVQVITAAIAHEDELRAITRLLRLELLLGEMLAQHEAQQAVPYPTLEEAGADPLCDFQEGQWWVLELDAWAKTGEPDQKRAVAVVHHMLRAARKVEQQAQAAEPVAHCALTPSGKIAYFDGKPMLMAGPDGNECHPVKLYTAPPVREPLTDEEIEGLREDGTFYESCKVIVRTIEELHGIGAAGGAR